MRILITSFILIINLVLQSTLFQGFAIRGILPNTAIIIIVSFALLRGSFEGAMIGFFSGLLQDLFFGTTLGYFSLLGLCCGYFVGIAHRDFYRENYLIPLTLCAVVTFVYELLIYLSSFLFRGNLNFFYYLNNLMLPETVYTSVLSILIYRLLYGINEFIEGKERYKRKLF